MPDLVMPFIDLQAQYARHKDGIDAAMLRVLDHGQYIMGPEVAEMEGLLAGYVGRPCVSVSSGTEALLIALMALEIGAGDEIITTPFTFAATAEVIALVGAVPVFVDIEADTCNIAASLIEAAITPRTKAIIPVSLYGQPADMAAIAAIAERHGLAVIDDAAQSFGATYEGRRSCALGTVGCTSFFPSKPLGCYGDGGALFADDPAFLEAARQIRVHGQSQRYRHTRIGLGGRMDTLQCAVIIAKWPHFAQEIADRARIGQRYDALMDARSIERVAVRPGRTSAYAQYTIMVDDRDAVRAKLDAAGIPTAVHYPIPMHHQPAYSRFAPNAAVPNAERAAQRVLSLPMHPWLSEPDQDRVAEAVANALA